MGKENFCSLVESAKALARQKGFDEEKVICPFEQICEGQKNCYYQEEDLDLSELEVKNYDI